MCVLVNTNRQITLECKPQITKDYVSFDYCYNGLTITELDVSNTTISLYPIKYNKIKAYELNLDSTANTRTKKFKVFFESPNDKYKWRYYPVIKGHEADTYYSSEPFTVLNKIDILLNQTPGTCLIFLTQLSACLFTQIV